jgi:DNA polymerase I-like protein with 3'-5' exonuclease and polymerase domains
MSDDDYGLGLKVHKDAYRELEEELAKAKSKLEEVGFRACCVLLERDEAREQRDRLAEAIRKHRDELELTSGDSVDRILWNTLSAVKGGSDE